MNMNVILVGMVAVVSVVACDQNDTDDISRPAPIKVSVNAEKVVRSDVQTWLFGEGTVLAIKREFLSFESAGRIIYVDPNVKEGDRVFKGQLIAYQEKNSLLENGTGQEKMLSHASVRDAKANLDLAQKTYTRFKKLREQGFTSQQEFDEAEVKLQQAQVAYQNSKIIADESRIISPMDGVIARLNIKQGNYFLPSQVQFTDEAGALSTVPVVIIDPSSFELAVSMPSLYYQQLSVGSKVVYQQGGSQSISITDQDRQSYIEGYVYSISPSIDPNTRTFSVALRSTQGAENLHDGEYLSAWIAGPVAKNALTVPIDSVRFENNKPYVFKIDKETNLVSKTFVTLGLIGKDNRELVSGLSLDDYIVTGGRSRLTDGDLVYIINTPASGKAAEVLP
ncbi:efflux RND transporter periplasmic adaptor subunit [Marinomonas profundimaris]|uniref:CzcB-like alpha-helical hairpin domain-containing protein n=1 Tax=Marinomonas profundimaris TaxID=1208321 RepID=W1RWE6_9GAMM|nr:efflux RND transporter periplasmic adaptor subunit [Marinomonas profundimaris]ETI61140.1 hypothetical protein D104_06560 [Marinomonas profundimaris]